MNLMADSIAKRWRFLLILAIMVLAQLPFLAADADTGLGWSRGPYTDEGAYTSQVRNYLLTGSLDFTESDALIKTPLFGALTWLVTLVFGDSMVIMRAACLTVSALLFAAAASGRTVFSGSLRLALPLVMLSYLPFQYGHLAMAESICLSLILLMVLLLGMRFSGRGRWTILAASAVGFLTYAFKIQYFYIALVPPIAFSINIVLGLLERRKIDWSAAIDLLLSGLAAAAFLGLFALVWIYPHGELFNYVLTTQVSERASGLGGLPQAVLRNVRNIRGDRHVWPILLLAGIAVLSLAYRIASRRSDGAALPVWRTAPALIPAVAWLGIESHKIALTYLPSRYFLSWIVSGGIVAVILIYEFLRIEPARASRDGAASSSRLDSALLLKVGVLAVLAANVILYARSVAKRQFVIHAAQSEFAARGEWSGKVVLGPWAPTLFWGSKAVTKPVWANYFNDENIIALHRPAALVSEPDEADSGRAFAADGVSFSAQPQYAFKIAQWTVNVYKADQFFGRHVVAP